MIFLSRYRPATKFDPELWLYDLLASHLHSTKDSECEYRSIYASLRSSTNSASNSPIIFGGAILYRAGSVACSIHLAILKISFMTVFVCPWSRRISKSNIMSHLCKMVVWLLPSTRNCAQLYITDKSYFFRSSWANSRCLSLPDRPDWYAAFFANDIQLSD